MPRPYTDEPILIVAIERLRQEVANIPLAIAKNSSRLPPPPVPQPTAFDRPQAVVLMGPDPLPVTIEGGPRPTGPGGPQSPKPDEGGFAKVMRAFVGTFASVLGPIAVFATLVGNELSGARVFFSALNLFASAVAPILLPVMYALAVGLAAASDMVFSRLKPALESFFRVVIDGLLPTLQLLADAAAQVAEFFAKLARASETPGGHGGPAGGSVAGAGVLVPGAVGAGVGFMAGGPLGALIGAGIGMGLGVVAEMHGTSDEAKKATADNEKMVQRELLFTMGSKGGVGTIRGNFAAAQTAATNMSPFQQKVLERFTDVLGALSRAREEPPRGVYTEGR